MSTPCVPATNTCAYPWQQMIIDLTGEVVPCCFWAGYGNIGKPLGNTNSDSLSSIWNGEAYQLLRQEVAAGPKPGHPCHECAAYRWSSGRYPEFSWPVIVDHEAGNCYILRTLPDSFDLAFSENWDGWVLTENGTPLSEPNALHDEIRTLGTGRYSFWGRSIYFSSFDNTDPRTNGRCYSLKKGTIEVEFPRLVSDSASGENILTALREYQAGNTCLMAKPTMISLISTADCNIDCPGCSQNTVRLVGVQHRKETVPDVLSHVPYLYQFIWHGGEPYLIKRFREFIDGFERSVNPNLNFGFTSNGTMLTEKELKKLSIFPRINASISIDSFSKETFELIRKGATFDKVQKNFLSALRRYSFPEFIMSCGMIVCKSNFHELGKNVRFAMQNGIGINFSPVLIYPVTEQLNVFEDFSFETKGWEAALDEADEVLALARESNAIAIKRIDPIGMIRDLRAIFNEQRTNHRTVVQISLNVRDSTKSLNSMRRPGVIVSDKETHAIVSYVSVNRTGYHVLNIPERWQRKTLFWRFVHDLNEPESQLDAGRIVPQAQSHSRRKRAITIVIPSFMAVARPTNINFANYGEGTPTGLVVFDTHQIWNEYKRMMEKEISAKSSVSTEKETELPRKFSVLTRIKSAAASLLK